MRYKGLPSNIHVLNVTEVHGGSTSFLHPPIFMFVMSVKYISFTSFIFHVCNVTEVHAFTPSNFRVGNIISTSFQILQLHVLHVTDVHLFYTLHLSWVILWKYILLHPPAVMSVMLIL
jgi:hypothetical protein